MTGAVPVITVCDRLLIEAALNQCKEPHTGEIKTDHERDCIRIVVPLEVHKDVPKGQSKEHETDGPTNIFQNALPSSKHVAKDLDLSIAP